MAGNWSKNLHEEVTCKLLQAPCRSCAPPPSPRYMLGTSLRMGGFFGQFELHHTCKCRAGIRRASLS